MRKKTSRIVAIVVFFILALMMLASTVNATIQIDGTTYYTKSDIGWHNDKFQGYGGYITVNGEKYYCINHNYALTKYLENDDAITKEIIGGEGACESQEVAKEFLRWKKLMAIKNTIWEGTVRALRLEFGEWNRVENSTESALYAFADEYCKGDSSASGYVQNAIWEYMREYEGQNYNNYASTQLYLAAKYYEEWCRIGKANLTGNDSYAKTNIKGSDYIVGPFTINYNQSDFNLNHENSEFEDIKYSWLDVYEITDEKGNRISASITDNVGNPLGGIPNNQDFYIKFPYDKNMKDVKIRIGVKYIDTVWGEKQDIITYSQEVKLEWTDTIDDVTTWEHDLRCVAKPGQSEITNTPCAWCPSDGDGGFETWWTAKSKSNVAKSGQERMGLYQNMRRFRGGVGYNNDYIELSAPLAPVPEEMDLAGYVWEDTAQGKDSIFNGLKDIKDIPLEGIEVRLYDKTLEDQYGHKVLAEISNGTNPTLTNRDGHYEFKGIISTHKYYVQFTYNGMLYTNTYGAGIPEYNTYDWNQTSKGSEVVSERDILNNKFLTINSYPASYRTTPIFTGDYLVNGNYNKIYAVNTNGERRVENALVQKYQNLITAQLRNYLSTHKRLEDGDANYINNIYIPIINSLTGEEQKEAKQVLQYIWDCRINAYAGNESERDGKTLRAGGKFYPYYDDFILKDKDGNRIVADHPNPVYNGYRAIYNGQLFINLGLILRPTADLELTEDLYQTVVSINGQDETYKYGTFSKKGVKLNANDFNANITQNIATSDYNYRINNSNLSSNLTENAAYPRNYAPIQMYVTYRINIKNNSSIPTSINEIATYIDTNFYSYSDTYTTTEGKTIAGIRGSYIYPISDTESQETDLSAYNDNNFGLKVSTNSICGTDSQTGNGLVIDGEKMLQDLYINFNNTVILDQNKILAVYITYRLGENSTKDAKYNCTYNSTQAGGENHAYAILQDLFGKSEQKKTYIRTMAEINSYSTFFKKDFDARDTQNKYNAYYKYSSDLSRGATYRAAGVFDALSIPGNLTQTQISELENNKNKIEDDWDKASTFVLVDNGGAREVVGNVWETVGKPANEWLNTTEYPKYNGQNNAQDITVELIEIKEGKQYVRARTKTNQDGSYRIAEYIPGIYTIRFIYGDTAKYDTEQYSKYTKFTLNGKEYKCAYNGEFYQSAKANPKTNENTYWYAVEKDDRYSDAYDEVTIRKAVNESLQNYKYSDETSLLKHPTDYMMFAYTSLLDIEVEYATETSTTQNPTYKIEKVDFALTPRTATKLKINKEVDRIKLVKQNGIPIFDTDTETIRNQGVPAVVQAAQGHDINISLSNELIDGATLEITYKITVTNESPEDTVTYYKDASGNIIALGFYKENPVDIVYYKDAMRTYSNRFQKQSDSTRISYIEAGETATKIPDIRKTETIETTAKPTVIADFISNNLTFNKVDYNGATINEVWDLYTGEKDDFVKEYYNQKDASTEKALNPQIEKEMDASEVYDSNVIVVSNDKNALVKTNLKHGESVSEKIVLSKIISVNRTANGDNNTTDTMSYHNKVRIVKANNSVSRIQDLNEEDVKHKSEHVTISDPTGIGDAYLGIIITLVVAATIGIGIVFIKKFVIK